LAASHKKNQDIHICKNLEMCIRIRIFKRENEENKAILVAKDYVRLDTFSILSFFTGMKSLFGYMLG